METPAEADDPSGSITGLYQRWRSGHVGSLDGLMARFRPRLLALARSTLSGRVQRIADAEDALQSAIISFWEKAERGDLNKDLDRNDLWNVLGLITVRKAIRQQTRERAQKRGGGQLVTGLPMEELTGSNEDVPPEMICAELLELLPPEEREITLLKLLGHSNREIAEQLGCSEKKVERKVHLVREIWLDEISRWNS